MASLARATITYIQTAEAFPAGRSPVRAYPVFAPRPHPEATGLPDGRELRAPVLGGQRAPALDSRPAGEGRGGPGRGSGPGLVYRQGGVIPGESTCIRERSRELGMSMGELEDRVGVSYGYMSRAPRSA